MSMRAGTRLDAYEIFSVLGAGGMGEVYRARPYDMSNHDGRFLAIVTPGQSSNQINVVLTGSRN